jgi:hypothetical protein
MNTQQYQPSYGEFAVLGEMFEIEIKVRGIKIPNEDQRISCWMDFCQQYIEDQDTDPHINCLEDVTCEKEVYEIDWDAVYG